MYKASVKSFEDICQNLFDNQVDDRISRLSKNQYNFYRYLEKKYDIIESIPEKAVRLLDIGCNVGTFEELLLNCGRLDNDLKVIGIDIAMECIERAGRKKLKNCFFLGASTYQLPFKDNSFDVVVASEVIEHIQNKPEMCLEINRVLKENGILILTTPNKTCLQLQVHNFIMKIAYRVAGMEYPEKDEYISAHQIANILKKSGFFYQITFKYPTVVTFSFRNKTYGIFPPLPPSLLLKLIKLLSYMDNKLSLPLVMKRFFWWTILALAQKPCTPHQEITRADKGHRS